MIVVFGPRRKLPAPTNFPELQSAVATIEILFQLSNGLFNQLAVFF